MRPVEPILGKIQSSSHHNINFNIILPLSSRSDHLQENVLIRILYAFPVYPVRVSSPVECNFCKYFRRYKGSALKFTSYDCQGCKTSEMQDTALVKLRYGSMRS